MTGGTSGTFDDAGVMCTPQYTHTYGFGAIYEGWAVSLYSTASLIPIAEGNGSPASGTKVELDTTDGAPGSTNGNLKLTIPFDSTAELLLLGNVLTPGVNLSGTKVTAQIKLDSGVIVGPSDTVRAYLVLKSTAGYNYLPGPSLVLDPSAGWQTLTIDGDMPSADAVGIGYAPCDVREIDIEIHTGDQGMYKAGVIKVDAVSVTPKSCL